MSGKKANDPLLPIGARVTVHGTHKGHVAGYGFTSEEGFNEAARGVGLGLVTRPCYLVRLDKGFYEATAESGYAMFVGVVAANPDNVKEINKCGA